MQAIVAAAAAGISTAAYAAETWRMTELAFESSRDYGTGDGDEVRLDCVFSNRTDGDARRFVFYFHSCGTTNMVTGTIVSAREGRAYSARWFDPRLGAWSERIDLGPCGKTNRIVLPPRPSSGDWALLVEEWPFCAWRVVFMKANPGFVNRMVVGNTPSAAAIRIRVRARNPSADCMERLLSGEFLI